MTYTKLLPIAAFVTALAGPTWADTDNTGKAMISSGLVLPKMDAAEGRKLYASKGCVVCHAINDIGGEDGPSLNAEFMDSPMNPFEFAARMWRGAESMVELQRDELGDVIELNGEELAAIIAFVHDADEQEKFSEADIPEEIEAMMGHMAEEEESGEGHGEEEESEEAHD